MADAVILPETRECANQKTNGTTVQSLECFDVVPEPLYGLCDTGLKTFLVAVESELLEPPVNLAFRHDRLPFSPRRIKLLHKVEEVVEAPYGFVRDYLRILFDDGL